MYGAFVVPVAQQAFGACTGSYDYSSFWVGIDGWNSSDVFQAGIEADAYCNGSTTAAYYSAWYEWYPYNEVRISSPGVAPGDLIEVYIWNTSRTVGNYYMVNYTRTRLRRCSSPHRAARSCKATLSSGLRSAQV